jgi:hypothetical protein
VPGSSLLCLAFAGSAVMALTVEASTGPPAASALRSQPRSQRRPTSLPARVSLLAKAQPRAAIETTGLERPSPHNGFDNPEGELMPSQSSAISRPSIGGPQLSRPQRRQCHQPCAHCRPMQLPPSLYCLLIALAVSAQHEVARNLCSLRLTGLANRGRPLPRHRR